MALRQSDEAYVRVQLYLMEIGATSEAKRPKVSEATASSKNEPVGAAFKGGEETAAPAPVDGAEKKQSFERRDKMREMESKMQQIWRDERTFEVDAEDEKKEKFFCTFPYPYMNGRLHLGHAFTVTKADFQAGYQRLKGKKVLFPFAFHCTGMPISAAATKLKRELENPVKEEDGEIEESAPAAPQQQQQTHQKMPDAKFASKKSKTAKKTGAAKTQSEILIKSGIPPEEVPKFVDPYYWLEYFPPQGEEDLRAFGLLCDWRRSFITTDANPYYDAFIKWQFRTLFKRGLLKRGKRPTICTPDDGQACADHDRSEGEGVQYQEYTLVKMKVVEAPPQSTGGENPFIEMFARLSKQFDIYLVPATLRPETMFGQTNCYVLPSGGYGLYRVSDKDVFVCGEHAARNLAFQGFPGEDGKMDCLGQVMGTNLIGTLIKAPLAVHDVVRVLPMETVSMSIGTAVVTSVPSDSPDDFMTYKTMRESEKFRATYGIDPEWVKPDIVYIIDIPGYAGPAAPLECEKLKIKSPKDADLLEKAKGEVYLQGFEQGVMRAEFCSSVPGVAGQKVKDAKPIVRQFLLDTNQGVKYWEPAKYVESRSGLECIVKHLDQWYLPYGEDEWREQVKKHVLGPAFTAYSPLAIKQYEITLSWLREWACSRSFGLGTRLPAFTSNDREGEFVIESLSDSTIYMAYYTVAHLLQGGIGNYTGVRAQGDTSQKLATLTIDVMSDDRVWDYVFLLSDESPYPLDSQVGRDIARLRKEFSFWYPLDLRVSGKDLIQNHLTMSLYNHAAVWQGKEDMWPRSFFANGHIQVESEKMSKSVGNFILLNEATRGQRQMTIKNEVKMIGWTADATRVALADGGDGLEDANFSCDVADNAVLRLFGETRFAEQVVADADTPSVGDDAILSFHEQVFVAQMDECIDAVDAAFASMRFRDALKFGFFMLSDSRDMYRKACIQTGQTPSKQLMLRFVEVYAQLNAPVCPHFAENIWRNVLKRSGSVFDSRWPAKFIADLAQRKLLLKKITYLEELEHKARTTLDKHMTKTKTTTVPGVTVFIATSVPEWHAFTCEFLRKLDQTTPQPDAMNALSQAMRADKDRVKFVKDAMKVAPKIYGSAQQEGASAYETASPFDEVELLGMYAPLLSKLLNIPKVEIIVEAPDRCMPGKPAVSVSK